jgi:nitroimidazol reductase NimA-like FMN-containing flavoprotein (pyridoxamine 5'-phosphate oxidase superfamily)
MADQPWIEYLRAEECWQLLSATPVGRIGVVVDSAPEIYPVNFAVDDRTVVFRTDPGSKLHGLERSPSVCFQVDGFDADARTGWSVLVKGRACIVPDDDERARLASLPLVPWGVGSKEHWVRIEPDEVTGRRVKGTRAPSPPA